VIERSVVTAVGLRPYRCRACGRRFYDWPTGRSSPQSPLVCLPAYPGNQWDTPQSGKVLAHDPKRVLVVEDDAGVRELLVDVLSEGGYEVFAVADGAPALVLLERIPVDVILLDLILKSVHGLEVLARLWANPALARVPVVVASGLGSVLEPALRHQVVDVLPKPLSLPQLIETVRRLTSGAAT